MKMFLNLISFRDNYWTAVFVYFGLGLLLLGITPDLPSVNALSGCGGEATCPNGQVCCGGVCCSSCVEGECCNP
ncbi:MAG: hypothetical protein LBC68_02280 [Prevotellaceae bacterium]|jgi:hypothetical protein|nr:hypothetical protein [Prevotellaceae bacterium]